MSILRRDALESCIAIVRVGRDMRSRLWFVMKKVTLICGGAAAIAAAVIGIRGLRPKEVQTKERDIRTVASAAKPVAAVVEKVATNEAAVREPEPASAPEGEAKDVGRVAEKAKPAAKPQKSASAAPKPGKVKEPIQDPDARLALALVGDDWNAEGYWVGAINNPALPANERKDLIEDLNEDGLSDPKHPGPEDLPLIVSRIQLIEELAPYAMDQVNADAFAEAYKDLIDMLDGRPVR
jgi:hypothetical protein